MGCRRRKRRAWNAQPKARTSRHGESPSETGAASLTFMATDY